jgi:lipopolysaccharide transport system ATP-binding protein
LFVSHNMYAVQVFCNRALWLEQGRVVGIGDTQTLVSSYLNNARETVHEVVWDDPTSAPGHSTMKLHRLHVKSAETGDDTLYVNKPVDIEIEYWNFVPDANLHLNLYITDEQNAIAFETGSYESGWHRKPHSVGLFRTVCHIPANLLNDNMYRIYISFIKNESLILCMLDDLMSFQVHDVPELRNVDYHDKWRGVIRPHLQWESEMLTDDNAHRSS